MKRVVLFSLSVLVASVIWLAPLAGYGDIEEGSATRSVPARTNWFMGLQAQGAWNYDRESSNFGYPLFEAGYRWSDFSVRGRLFPIIATMGAADVGYAFYRSGGVELAATASYAFRSMYSYWSDSLWIGFEAGWDVGTLQYFFSLSHALVYHEERDNKVNQEDNVAYKYLALGMGVRFW